MNEICGKNVHIHITSCLLHVKLFLDVYKEIYEICESQGARLLTAALQ